MYVVKFDLKLLDMLYYIDMTGIKQSTAHAIKRTPHFLLIYRCNNPRGMLGYHECFSFLLVYRYIKR